MGRVFIFLSLASILLAAAALISVLSVEDNDRIRGLPRFAWVILIVVAPLIGSIAYFVAGRPLPAGGRRGRWPFGGDPAPAGPKAPDDDPDFLRSLDERAKRPPDETDLLRQYEEELRDEDRRRDPGPEA